MLYLKNSLVNLTIILFFLFFLTILSAENANFIFPKKKIVTIKPDTKKLNNLKKISKSFKSVNLPQKNPSRESFAQQKKTKDSTKKLTLIKKKKHKYNYC